MSLFSRDLHEESMELPQCMWAVIQNTTGQAAYKQINVLLTDPEATSPRSGCQRGLVKALSKSPAFCFILT